MNRRYLVDKKSTCVYCRQVNRHIVSIFDTMFYYKSIGEISGKINFHRCWNYVVRFDGVKVHQCIDWNEANTIANYWLSLYREK